MKLLKRFWRWLCKTKTRTVALLFAIIYSIAFTVAVMIMSALKIQLPAELIICVFIEVGIIGLTSGAITISKIKLGEAELEMNSGDDTDDS